MPADVVAEPNTYVVFDGIESSTFTSVAAVLPVFDSVIVYVNVSPGARTPSGATLFAIISTGVAVM